MSVADFSNICRNDGRLSEEVEHVVQPRWKMSSTILRKVHPSNGTQFDAKRLKKNCEDVRHEYNEEKFVFERSACGDVGSVVSCKRLLTQFCLILLPRDTPHKSLPGSI